ncbi:MAG: hypothetical protein B7X04_03895 [Parcubacteria group bacterium 21-54-25]|nr:MAG: hypothetical protein B7X04_03895 [Parcubacteria group bacterium 21-54-25]
MQARQELYKSSLLLGKAHLALGGVLYALVQAPTQRWLGVEQVRGYDGMQVDGRYAFTTYHAADYRANRSDEIHGSILAALPFQPYEFSLQNASRNSTIPFMASGRSPF